MLNSSTGLLYSCGNVAIRSAVIEKALPRRRERVVERPFSKEGDRCRGVEFPYYFVSRLIHLVYQADEALALGCRSKILTKSSVPYFSESVSLELKANRQPRSLLGNVQPVLRVGPNTLLEIFWTPVSMPLVKRSVRSGLTWRIQ